MSEPLSKEFVDILELINSFVKDEKNNLILGDNKQLQKGDIPIALTPHAPNIGDLIGSLEKLDKLYFFRIKGSKMKDHNLFLLTDLKNIFFIFIETSILTDNDILLTQVKIKYRAFKIKTFKIKLINEKIVYYFEGHNIYIDL